MSIDCGVPQGSVLGPLLFLIYMNDLPSCLSHSRVILFADDTTLYSSSSNLKLLYDNMNQDLQRLVDWFRANKLSLNTSKTNYLTILSKRQIDDIYQLSMDTEIIEKKDCCKFLGICIDNQLKWTQHILQTRSKISKSLYALNRCKHFVPLKCMKTMYDSLIHSHLTYGITLWGATFKTHLNCLQVLQKKAIRSIYNANYNAHTLPLFTESKVLRLDELYEYELGKYMYGVQKKLVPAPLINIYIRNIAIHHHHTRQRDNFHVDQRRNRVTSNYIVHKGPLIWSQIPELIKSSRTMSSFKLRFKMFHLDKYNDM